MKKKQVCSDYDEYLIKMPLSKLFLGRTQYVFSELEKRHPCFSDSFEVDIHTRIKNKKIFASVAVIEKENLLKYRRNNNLVLCNKEGKVIFKDRNYFILLLCLLFIFAILFLLKIKPQEIEPEVQTVQETVFKEADCVSWDYCFTEVLNKIEKTSGKISRFSWKIENQTEIFTASFKGVHPLEINMESFSGVIVSPVEYENNIPSFSLNVRKKIENWNSVVLTENLNVQYRKILDSIKNNGGKILSDSLKNNNSIVLIKFNLDDLEKVEKIMDPIRKESFVSCLEINPVQEGFNVYMEIISEGFNGLLEKDFLKQVADKAGSFERLKQNEKTETGKSENLKIEKDELKKINETRKKIGEIVYGNGTRSIYYKNERGKLENEKM